MNINEMLKENHMGKVLSDVKVSDFSCLENEKMYKLRTFVEHNLA